MNKCFYDRESFDALLATSAFRIGYGGTKYIPYEGDEGIQVNKHDVLVFIGCHPKDPDLIETIISKAAVFCIIDNKAKDVINKHNLKQRLKYPDTFIDEGETLLEVTLKWMELPLNKYSKIALDYIKGGRENQTLCFYHGLQSELTGDLSKDFTPKLKRLIRQTKDADREYFQGLLPKGQAILNYRKKKVSELGFTTKIKGYPAFCVNIPAQEYDFTTNHKIKISFFYTNKGLTFRFFSDIMSLDELREEITCVDDLYSPVV